MTYKKVAKVAQNFHCLKCDYFTDKKCDYEKHLQTKKHKNGKILINDTQNVANKFFSCDCGKIYKHSQSLYNHKKKCIFYNDSSVNDSSVNDSSVNDSSINDSSNNSQHVQNSITQDVVLKLINENNDIKKLLVTQQQQLMEQQKHLEEQHKQLFEIVPKIGNNTINNNQRFNINVFLNEKCKDAINMTDFIKSIEVSLQQLDFTKQNGLATGLSKTIVDSMNKLSLYERPMHCTDVKRETLYIKDEDTWSKDNNKEKIKRAIKKASGKNYNALQDWKTTNPDFLENDSKTDYFTKTITTIGKPTETIDDKVIKNLCKETYIKDCIE